MENCDSISAPLPPNLHLQKDMDKPLVDPSVYRQLVGKLNFLIHTRPDLAFSIQFLSQFSQNPCDAQYSAALHVLKYLKGTTSQGIFLNNKPEFGLEAYCDSDWAACPITRRSVSGFFILFGGTPLSWKSKKQVIVSLSSAEAQYRSIAKNPVFHKRTKPIELDCHFVREKLQAGLISLSHVSTHDQLADMLTKSLPGSRHKEAVFKLRISPYPPA